MTGIFALPALALISAVSLRKALQERWAVALIVTVALGAMVAIIEIALPLPLTISERVALWCLPVLAATDAATRSVSRAALSAAVGFSVWGHARQGTLVHSLEIGAIACLVTLALIALLRMKYGNEVIGSGDGFFGVWLALALGIVAPVSFGLGVLLAGRRREVPLVTYAALATVIVVCFLAIWGRFPWRS